MSSEIIDNFERLVSMRGVKKCIENKDYLSLAMYLGKKYCGFTDDDIDYIEHFWDPAFNKGWFYASKQMVVEEFGYKESGHVMRDFHNKLIDNYDDKVDYLQVNEDHKLVKAHCDKNLNGKKHGGVPKKYFIISGECFKMLLQSAQTERGREIRKYYIRVESLCAIFNKFLFMYMSHREQEQVKLLIEEKKKIENELKKEAIRYQNLFNINKELLSYKKFIEKNERIYIVSSWNYARQGIFKIGQTKNMQSRSSQHNNTRIGGDKFKILEEFKVNDSQAVEKIIHRKLKGLLVKDTKEFFMCPFRYIKQIVAMIVKNDDEENDSVNTLIDAVFELKQNSSDPSTWLSDHEREIFGEEMKLILPAPPEIDENGEEIPPEQRTERKEYKFDVTTATAEQKQAFVAEVIDAYRRTIGDQQLKWKDIQSQIISATGIPKYKFKALDWKPLVQTENSSRQLSIRWR